MTPSFDGRTGLSRRRFLTGATALASLAVLPGFVEPKRNTGRFGVSSPTTVRFGSRARAGSIVVKTNDKRLYLVLGNGRARRYTIAVGAAGRAFRGQGVIGRKAKWPRWTPTKNMIRREPGKYKKYASGVPGGPNNPLGARALYLFRGGRDTMYRIHGTNNPRSIGQAVSNGCIRMLNDDAKDLYTRVRVGARVYVQ
ncbi:MAG: L,D-transpeptidase [Pseudomonadota bacterium]